MPKYRTFIVQESVNSSCTCLKVLDKFRKPYDLVIMDLTIPGGMGGKEAVGKLHEIDPDARVVVSSGYASDPVMANPEGHGFVGAIKKPVGLDELAETLDRLLGAESA